MRVAEQGSDLDATAGLLIDDNPGPINYAMDKPPPPPEPQLPTITYGHEGSGYSVKLEGDLFGGDHGDAFGRFTIDPSTQSIGPISFGFSDGVNTGSVFHSFGEGTTGATWSHDFGNGIEGTLTLSSGNGGSLALDVTFHF